MKLIFVLYLVYMHTLIYAGGSRDAGWSRFADVHARQKSGCEWALWQVLQRWLQVSSFYAGMQCVVVRCSVVQCVAVCCSVLQCVAVLYSLLQCFVVMIACLLPFCNDATCFQYVLLQRVAARRMIPPLPLLLTRCNTLQQGLPLPLATTFSYLHPLVTVDTYMLIQNFIDRVTQNLEIISKIFDFCTRRTRILVGFIISTT